MAAVQAGGVRLYNRLSAFFSEHFPDIKLASELEKGLLMRDLAASTSFSKTHRVIAALKRFSDFTPSELNDIVFASISNDQVYRIIEDQDVRSFIEQVIADREDQIERTALIRLRQLLDRAAAAEILTRFLMDASSDLKKAGYDLALEDGRPGASC